jgi:hypothetical protein
MENSLIPQGIEIVQRAIAADNENEYEKALALYRDALARFTMGLKYEKNEARKKLIIDRVEGYMNRAEELSDYLKKQSELDKGGGGGVAAKSKDDKDEGGEDADKKKLRGALAGAIVTEKPNVSWEDVAGLENAKESLKEVRIILILIRYDKMKRYVAWWFRVVTYSLETFLTHIQHLLIHFFHYLRRSFYPPNSRNSLPENAHPLKESSSTVHPEPENPT